MSPAAGFLIVLVIGIAIGVIFDRVAGPGWLTRQIGGPMRTVITSALIGIAGAFIGSGIAGLAGLRDIAAYIAAAVGAAVVLWAWRMVR